MDTNPLEELFQGEYVFLVCENDQVLFCMTSRDYAQTSIKLLADKFEKTLDTNLYKVVRVQESDDCIVIMAQKQGYLYNGAMKERVRYHIKPTRQVFLFKEKESHIVELPAP